MFDIRKGDYLVTQPEGRGLILLGTFANDRQSNPMRPHEILFRLPLKQLPITAKPEQVDMDKTVVDYLTVAPLYPCQDFDRRNQTENHRIEGIPMVFRTNIPEGFTEHSLPPFLVEANILRDPNTPYDLAAALVRTGDARNPSNLYEFATIVGELHPEDQHTIRRAMFFLGGILR